MNKYAAEKIASEYYNLGLQLALQNAGITKTAAPSAKQLAALLGGGAGGSALALNANQLPKFLGGDTAMAKAIAEYAAKGETGLLNAGSGAANAIGNAYNKALQGVYGLAAEGTPMAGFGM